MFIWDFLFILELIVRELIVSESDIPKIVSGLGPDLYDVQRIPSYSNNIAWN